MRLTSLDTLPPAWTAHGLRFSQRVGEADVQVGFGPTPLEIDRPRFSGRRISMAPGDWLLRLEQDVRVRVRGGRDITIDAPPSVNLPELVAWIQGPAIVAVLYQRGLTPLHAAAVAIGGRIFAILAPSGTGKSSLAAALLADGASFVTDDVLTIRTGAEGFPVGFPGPPVLRLPPGLDERTELRGLSRIGRDHDGKLLTRPDRGAIPGPVPLGGLFLYAQGSRLSIEPLQGVTLLRMLHGLIQRPRMARALGAEQAVFATLGAVATKVRAWQLTRPSAGWSLRECQAMIRRVLAVTGPANDERTET